jgi:hypothetical protein
MARTETDRDDLFAEAVALTRRWEGVVPACPVPIMAGFKVNGDVSIYFGPDRVYHCDAEGRFRRAFIDGLLYRTHGETLSRMRRDRSEAETSLLRSELSAIEAEAFRDEMVTHLAELRQALLNGELTALRRFPSDDARIESDLAMMIGTIVNAQPWLAPALVTRR